VIGSTHEDPTGRTKTLPAAGAAVSQVRFAVLSCQDWSVNHWAAFDLLLQEDLDFIIHLGDYIYETVGEAFQTGAVESRHAPLTLPDGVFLTGTSGPKYANTLNDYRYLYKTYRSDSRLQALHARFPVIAVWDDHEFTDDAWQDRQTYDIANPQQTARRRTANQAWFEYMPADVTFDAANAAFNNIQIYRDFKVGNLAHIVVTDERLYRADHVIDERLAGSSIGSRYFVPRDAVKGVESQKIAAGGLDAVSMLGGTQRAWWKARMSETGTTWKIWGNEVSLLRMQLDLRLLAPPPNNVVSLLNADQWDGYDAERRDLMAHLKNNGIRNVVAVTGDLHAFFAGQVMDDWSAATPTPVMVDLVGAGVSSNSFFSFFKDAVDTNRDNVPDGPNAALSSLVFVNAGAAGIINTFNETIAGPLGATIQQVTGTNPYGPAGGTVNNPWIKYVDTDAQGYLVVTLTQTQMQAQFKKVKRLANGAVPADPLSGVKTVTVAAGSTTLVVT
jgi:alkaline phosphatase D